MLCKRAALIVALLGILLGTAPSARAEPDAFIRMDQTTWLGKYQLGITYGLEAKTALRDIEKPDSDGGDGGGGGLGGRRSYQGVTHRLWTGFGITDWLSASMDHTMGQTVVNDVQYKTLVLQLRGHWQRIFPNLPVELDTFAESRIRVNARRQPSAVIGVGIGRTWGRLHLFGDVGFETTLNEIHRENGMRYRLAFAVRAFRWLRLALEAWGSLVWPEYSVFQQDHHGGPSILFRYKRAWLGVNVAVGMKERPHRYFVDLVTMGKLGLQF